MITETITLQMPFPIIDFGRPVYKHTKVTKLSVLGYILLVYIKRGDGDRILADNIAEAGIRGEMTELFGDELFELVFRRKMVEYVGPKLENYNDYRRLLIQHQTKEFRLTHLGERLFRDQFVSDGDMKTNRIELCYNPAEKTFFFPNIRKELRTENIADLLGTSSFEVDPPEVTSESAVEFLNSVKESVLKLEKQEMVTEILDLFPGFQVRPRLQELKIDINSYGAAFLCDKPVYLEYLTNQYKSEWIDYILTAETGKLEINQIKTIPIGDIEALERIVFPKKIHKVHKDKNIYHLIWTDQILSNGNIKAESKDHLKLNSEQSETLCRHISPLCVGAALNEEGKLLAYESYRLEIPKKGIYGKTIHTDALVERTIKGEIRDRYISNLGGILREREWNQDNLKEAIWLSSIDKSIDYLNIFLETQFEKQTDFGKKIDMIKEARQLSDESLNEILKVQTEDIWKLLQIEGNLENLGPRIDLIKDLSILLNVDIDVMLTTMISNLKEPYSTDKLLQILLDAEIVSDVRAFELTDAVSSYVKRIVNRDPIEGSHGLAMWAIRMQKSLVSLCDMIGIQGDPITYFPRKIENPIEYKHFLEILVMEYRDFKKTYRSLSAKEDADLLESYYTAIVDFNQKRAGEKDIDKYSQEDFMLLAHSSPEDCVARLQQRLELLLREKLGFDDDDRTSMNTMLKIAFNKNIVSNEEHECLKNLKEVRNKLVHSAKADMTGMDLDEAIEIVFALIERKFASETEAKAASEALVNQDEESLNTSQSGEMSETVLINYPHKRKYLINVFKTNPSAAIGKLKECECYLLETIFSKKLYKENKEKNMRVELNNARTKGILPEETAIKIVEFNRTCKDRQITSDDLHNFIGWVDAFWSVANVRLPKCGTNVQSQNTINHKNK